MLTVFIRLKDGTVERQADEARLCAALREPETTFWIDIEHPTDNELALLDDVFGFHPLAIEDVIHYQQRPKIESYNHTGDSLRQGYFFMVVNAVRWQRDEDGDLEVGSAELDLFVSDHYLVTVHDEPIPAVTETINRTAADVAHAIEGGIDMLLYRVLDRVVDGAAPVIDQLQDRLDDLEEEAVERPGPQTLGRITASKRDLLTLRRIIGPHREVVAQLTRGDVPFIRESTRVYLRDVLDHLIRAVETLELYRDLIIGARDIYLSSISNKLNTIMKTLTLISVIALPLTVVTSFFGMNFEAIPGLHSTMAFWITVVVMIVLVAGLVGLFKWRRWI